MRKIIYAQLNSLDGYIEDTDGNIGGTNLIKRAMKKFDSDQKKYFRKL